jgi:hypothetical protein
MFYGSGRGCSSPQALRFLILRKRFWSTSPRGRGETLRTIRISSPAGVRMSRRIRATFCSPRSSVRTPRRTPTGSTSCGPRGLFRLAKARRITRISLVRRFMRQPFSFAPPAVFGAVGRQCPNVVNPGGHTGPAHRPKCLGRI